MASAVVGALRVLLEVNASQLEGEFGKATITIGNFDKFTQNAGRNLQRMVEGFSGQKIVAEATTMAAAIEKVGGISALTEKELKRVAGTVNEATAKLKAMGVEVPPSIAKIKGEIDALGMASQKTGGFFASLGQAGKFLAPLLPITSVAGLTAAVIGMGKSAIESAGQISDLSERTGLSAEAIQRMQHVANQTGSTLETFTNGAFQLGVRVAEGTTKARDAVAALGLSYDQLKAQKPEQQFAMVVEALEGVDNVQERNRLGVALFGKAFAEMAPAVAQGYSDIAKAAAVSSDAQIEALDAAGDAWQKFVDDSSKRTQSWLGDLVLKAQAIGRTLDVLSKDWMQAGTVLTMAMLTGQGQRPEQFLAKLAEAGKARRDTDIKLKVEGATAATKELTDYVKALQDAQKEVAGLDSKQRTQLNAALKLGGQAAKDYAEEIGLSEAALRLYQAEQAAASKATKDAETAAKKAADALKKLNEQIKEFAEKNVHISEAIEKGWLGKLTKDVMLDNVTVIGAVGASMGEAQKFAEDWARANGAVLAPSIKAVSSAASTDDLERWAKEAKDADRAARDAATNGIRNLAQGFANLAQVAGDNNIGATLRAMGELVTGVALARDGVDALGKGFQQFKTGNFASGFASMASGIMGVVGAMEQATRGTSKWMAALGGAAVGFSFGGVFGAIAGVIVGLARSSKAAGDEQKKLQEQVRKTSDELRKQAAAMAPLLKVLGLTDDIARMIAEADTLEELEKLREELARISKEGDKLNDEFRDLFDLIENAGFSIPPELELFFDSFMDILDPSNKAKLQSLLGVIGDMEVPWEKMQAAAEKFGIDIGSLGQKFQAGKLKASATEIINAFEMLTKNGADVGGVLFGMRDEISALVRDARKFGTEIPAQMKPWIEELLRAGHLVDENGDALQDLGGIRFGPPIESQFDKILKKIDELIDRFIHLIDVIGKVPKLPSDIIPEPGSTFPTPDERIQPFANGGLVTRPTLALLGERGPEMVTPLRRYANPRAVPIPNLSSLPGIAANIDAPNDRPALEYRFMEAVREMREDLKAWQESFGDSLAIMIRDAAMGAV